MGCDASRLSHGTLSLDIVVSFCQKKTKTKKHEVTECSDSEMASNELALSTAELQKGKKKEWTPDLMPFHIGYDGPAPVSTYMMVKKVKRGVGMPDTNDKDGDVEMDEAQDGRYESTFRGRTMHGMDVDLPGGYKGLVVRSEGGSSEEKEGKTKGRRLEEEGERRVVVAAGEFSGVRVWHADTAVDGGRDEFVRSLDEWTALADSVSGEVPWEAAAYSGADASGRAIKPYMAGGCGKGLLRTHLGGEDGCAGVKCMNGSSGTPPRPLAQHRKLPANSLAPHPCNPQLGPFPHCPRCPLPPDLLHLLGRPSPQKPHPPQVCI